MLMNISRSKRSGRVSSGENVFVSPGLIYLFHCFALDGFEAGKFGDFYDLKKNIDPWRKTNLVRSIREDNRFYQFMTISSIFKTRRIREWRKGVMCARQRRRRRQTSKARCGPPTWFVWTPRTWHDATCLDMIWPNPLISEDVKRAYHARCWSEGEWGV